VWPINHQLIANPRSQHLKRHETPYHCKQCEKAFALQSDLRRHEASIHRASQPRFNCAFPGCTSSSKRKDNLRQHQRTYHNTSSSFSDPETKVRDFGHRSSDDEADESLSPNRARFDADDLPGIFGAILKLPEETSQAEGPVGSHSKTPVEKVKEPLPDAAVSVLEAPEANIDTALPESVGEEKAQDDQWAPVSEEDYKGHKYPSVRCEDCGNVYSGIYGRRDLARHRKQRHEHQVSTNVKHPLEELA
jgi:ribosomal protein L34E